MNLLDRYLAAVRQSLFLVRSEEKDDIIRELTEELRSELEQKEAELGRALSENEQDKILQRYGHPLIVAGRYRPNKGVFSFGRQIVGPELFPLYRLVLVISVMIATVILSVIALFNEESVSFATVVTQLAFQTLVITSIFAIADASARRSATSGWSTMSLPEPPDPNAIPRGSSIAELIFALFLLSIWVDLPWFPTNFALKLRGIEFDPGTVWSDFHQSFFIPIFIVIVASLVLAVTNLIRPQWTRMRLAVNFALDFASAAMLGTIVLRHWPEVKAIWSRHAIEHAVATQSEIANAWVNLATYWILTFICVACIGEAIWALVKIARWKRVPNGIPNLAA